MSKIKPLGNRIVLKRSEVETKKNGIIIPDASQEKPKHGRIIAVGPGKYLENGSRSIPSVKEGDLVIFNKYAGTEIKSDDEDYLIMGEEDILAILED